MTALGIVTVAERKEREASRRAQAAAAVVEAMRSYVQEHDGRFTVFGSFVTGSMRHDSDLDILIDFDASKRMAAWEFLEDLSSRYGLELDLFDRSATK